MIGSFHITRRLLLGAFAALALGACVSGPSPQQLSTVSVRDVTVEVLPIGETLRGVDYTDAEVKTLVEKALADELAKYSGSRKVDASVTVTQAYVPSVGAMFLIGAFAGTPIINGTLTVTDVATSQVLASAIPVRSGGTARENVGTRINVLAIGLAEQVARTIGNTVQPQS